jgi:hypothetical protein
MLVVKMESSGKELSHINVLSESECAFTRRRPGSPFCDYMYETKPRKGLSVPKNRGALRDHFREQSVWVLIKKVFQDMHRRGFLSDTQGDGERGNLPRLQEVAGIVDLCPDVNSEATEIGRIILTAGADGCTYKITDPKASPFALEGGGSLRGSFEQQSAWLLLEMVLLDMEKNGILKQGHGVPKPP